VIPPVFSQGKWGFRVQKGMGLRRAFWRQLDPEAYEHEGLSPTNKVIVLAVILSSIALWWSVCTLTTVGYGDIYPHTVLGKICGGITSFAGIGLIAMRTSILAAAFSDAFQRSRTRQEHGGS
jgi:hypothetical protein